MKFRELENKDIKIVGMSDSFKKLIPEHMGRISKVINASESMIEVKTKSVYQCGYIELVHNRTVSKFISANQFIIRRDDDFIIYEVLA